MKKHNEIKEDYKMKKYIYICSAGHSGSTLLDLLIGSHSKVESLGEITQLPKNIALNTICTCGVPVRECGLWRKVINRFSSDSGTDINKKPYALNLGFINATVIVDREHQTKYYNIKRKIHRALAYADMRTGIRIFDSIYKPIDHGVRNNIKLYDIVLNIQEKKCIVDSSKDYLKGVKLYREEPEKVKLLLLTRDGRGVMYSNIKRGYPRNKSILEWRNHYSRALKLIERYISKDDFKLIKYEEIATSPIQKMKEICNWVGLQFEDKMLDFLSHTHHIANGNNMRFGNTSTIRLDDKWRTALSEEDIRTFNRYAGSINQRLGYE